MKNFEFEHKGKKYWYSRSVAVLGIITGNDINYNNYVLANKRGKNTPDYQGYWCMPCGYLDFNETCEQAMQRETSEESGIIIPINKFELLCINSTPEDRQNVTIRYRAKLGNIHNYNIHTKNSDHDEVDEVKWIYLGDVNNYKWAFNHKDLIKQYLLNKDL